VLYAGLMHIGRSSPPTSVAPPGCRGCVRGVALHQPPEMHIR